MSDARRGQVEPERRISDPDFGELTCWFERESSGQLSYYWRTAGKNPDADVCIFDGGPDGFAVAAQFRDQFRKLAASEKEVRRLLAERHPSVVENYAATCNLAPPVRESFMAQLRPNWINVYPANDPPVIEMVFGDGWSDAFFVAGFNAIDGVLLNTEVH